MNTIRITLLVLWLTAATSSQADDARLFSGSGYAAVEGSVVNYTYNNFGGFYFLVEENLIRWEGFHGYFFGLVSANPPQISEVAPDVFLFSWKTRGTGSDNVVHNYNTMRVTAHLQPDEGRGDAIEMIHGVVHCRNTPDCVSPSEMLTPRAEMATGIGVNAREFGFPPLFDPRHNNAPRALADINARDELAGRVFVYDTPEGEYRIEVAGDRTWVSIGGGEQQTYQTYASKLADNLYFVSWMGGIGGTHVVINGSTKQVFDHILPSGERRESIYDLQCFDFKENC